MANERLVPNTNRIRGHSDGLSRDTIQRLNMIKRVKSENKRADDSVIKNKVKEQERRVKNLRAMRADKLKRSN